MLSSPLIGIGCLGLNTVSMVLAVEPRKNMTPISDGSCTHTSQIWAYSHRCVPPQSWGDGCGTAAFHFTDFLDLGTYPDSSESDDNLPVVKVHQAS